MTGASELETRIEEVRRQNEEGYEKALKNVKMLKDIMTELEQTITKKKQRGTAQDLRALRLAITRLNRLTDIEISRSKSAWEEYRKLEQESRRFQMHPVRLDDLRVLCKKMEELAADLLCYSLGRFESLDFMQPPINT